MTQECNQSEADKLREDFKKEMECAFYSIGITVGEQIKAIIDTEINNHLKSIENLKSILQVLPGLTNTCAKNTQSSGEGTDE